MSLAVQSDLPAELIRSLNGAQQAPNLSGPEREAALVWLRFALVDFEALDQHIALLQQLYQAPFRYPRPRRDGGPGGESASRFPHARRLPDERITAVIDGGVEMLTNAELGELLVNPVALFDLFDVINELHPDVWLDAMREAGSRHLVPSPPPTPKVIPPSEASVFQSWHASPWLSVTLALGLFAAVGASAWLAWQWSAADHKRLDALAELEAVKGRNTFAELDRDRARLLAASAGFKLPPYKVWDSEYIEGDSPKENLDRLAAAAGKEVKKEIERQRKEGKPDFAILAEFRLIAEHSRKARE